MLLSPLALRDLHEHVDRADRLTRGVMEWGWIRNKRHSGAVRSLGDSFRRAPQEICRSHQRPRARIPRSAGRDEPT
jgi:hypothetical protein